MSALIFGIDHGNGNIKTEHCVFPCGLVKSATKPARFLDEDILEYNGSYYMLSETRLPFKQDKSTDEDYFILTLFAICKEARERKLPTLTGKDLILGVGLPPADFSMQAESFKKYFMDKSTYGIKFNFNEKEISFYIRDCIVTPQNYAAIISFKSSLLKQNRTVFGIDIGEGTVDLLVIKKGKPDMAIRVSNKSGIAVLKSEIINRIQQDFGYQLTSDDVEEVLMEGNTVLDDDVICEIQKITDEWVTKIVNELHTHVPDFRTNYTVFIGGGSALLKTQINRSSDFKKIEFIDDIKANAIGYANAVKVKVAS